MRYRPTGTTAHSIEVRSGRRLCGGGEHGSAHDVAGDVEAEVRRRGVGRDTDGGDVERVHDDHGPVRAVAGGRGGTEEAGHAGVVGQLVGAAVLAERA
jgi:hypothetical protein